MLNGMINITQWQNRRKTRLKECTFDNMALYFGCRINKSAFLQTVFLVILSTGHKMISYKTY